MEENQSENFEKRKLKMAKFSLLIYFKQRASRLCNLIPLFYLSHYFIGFIEGNLNVQFLNQKAFEINEKDLEGREKILGFDQILLNRKTIQKYSNQRAIPRFLKNRNTIQTASFDLDFFFKIPQNHL